MNASVLYNIFNLGFFFLWSFAVLVIDSRSVFAVQALGHRAISPVLLSLLDFETVSH